MKLYRYLPTIIRLRDSLASGFPPDSGVPEQDLPPAGASSTLAGNVAAYNFRRAPAPPVVDYNVYYVRWEVSTDGSPYVPLEDYEWQVRRDEQRLEASFPLLDNGKETFHHFRVRVYGNAFYDDAELIWERDSRVDQTNWTIRLQPIFERIFYMLEADSSVQQMLIRDLPVLVDADRTEPMYLVYLAFLIGGADRFPGNLSEFRQREFVKSLVDLFKIKGTQLALKKLARLRNLGTINLRELYKSTFNEVGDYSAAQDDGHPLKSARVQLMACETQCESFAEFDASGVQKPTTNLSVSEQIQLLERDLDDFRPVHVLVCRLLETTNLESEWPTTAESIRGSRLRAMFVDSFPDIAEDLELVQTCVGQCEVMCQLCEELTMKPAPYDEGEWLYKVYDTPPVKAGLNDFYDANKGGFPDGFVTGSAPEDYYTRNFFDDDFIEGVVPFTAAVWANHSEIVLRKLITLNWVTGVVVIVQILMDDWCEVYWNETPITPLIESGSAVQYIDFDDGLDRINALGPPMIEVEVPESVLAVGSNLVAVRAADHIGGAAYVNLNICVSFRKSADADQDKSGTTTVTF